MSIPWIDARHPVFPDIKSALNAPNGLLAAGGNLDVDTLLDAYRHGIFPWYSEPEPILWWSPDPRLILIPSELHISRSLHQSLRRNLHRENFSVTLNRRFSEVIEACSQARKQSTETWISDAMKQAYTALHEAGHAHSIEVIEDDKLVGGLYGIGIGKMFFGESMFSRKTDASKIALVCLCRHLEEHGFSLIDCQVKTEHLLGLGAKEIGRADFCEEMQILCNQNVSAEVWQTLHSPVLQIPR